MNVNRTHRLTIVDRHYQVRQIASAESKKTLKIARQNNLLKIVSQQQNQAA